MILNGDELLQQQFESEMGANDVIETVNYTTAK